MGNDKDLYKEPSIISESLFKDKGSKHFGYVFPVQNEQEIELHLNTLRKKHYAARHVCYAWSLGIREITSKSTDDGEPHNTAGKPIYGQLNSFEVTNVLVVVIRYFGGTKLGVGGLIQAYKEGAKLALENTLKSVESICYNVGYEDIRFFRALFKRHTGLTPTVYRQRFGIGGT